MEPGSSNSGKTDEAHEKQGQNPPATNRNTVQPKPKQQPDGSSVTTPTTDPANSDETLDRNRDGNS
jgi:hypothetical protein